MDTPNYNAQTAHGETILMPRTDFLNCRTICAASAMALLKCWPVLAGISNLFPSA